jgi:hypothetical protein
MDRLREPRMHPTFRNSPKHEKKTVKKGEKDAPIVKR